MPANLDPQLALDEQAITNPDLEAALERHLRAKDDANEAAGVVRSAREDIDRELAKVDGFAPDTALRVGRFRITKTHVDGRSVAFDVKPRDQVRIGLVDEDGAPAKRASTVAGGPSVSDDEDLRPAGPVNVDALKGEADRASEPTPIKRPRNGSTQPPATH